MSWKVANPAALATELMVVLSECAVDIPVLSICLCHVVTFYVNECRYCQTFLPPSGRSIILMVLKSTVVKKF